MKILLLWLTVVLSQSNAVDNATAGPLEAKPLTLPNVDVGGGWTRWDGIGDLKGAVGWRERATSLHMGQIADVWIGTSHGRVLRYADGGWTLELQLPDLQITGIALQQDTVWLSTSDGMRQLARPKSDPAGKHWNVKAYREYYSGHPTFVSAAYIRGEDAVRLWGYVDRVYVPELVSTYAPFAISEEHGLFSGDHPSVWHHFLPHFWGANSQWLDTRELIPHRRPTCMVEDKQGSLWIGTDGDGLIRINARARHFNQRGSTDNAKDGKEFSYFTASEVGCEFVRVNAVSAGHEQDVWVALSGRDKRRYVARFSGDKWTYLELPQIKRRTTSGTKLIKIDWWEATPLSIIETAPRRLLVGVKDAVGSAASLYELEWDKQKFEKVSEVKYPVHNLERRNDGSIWAQTSWNVYVRKKQQ